jgi:hypothetical protein
MQIGNHCEKNLTWTFAERCMHAMTLEHNINLRTLRVNTVGNSSENWQATLQLLDTLPVLPNNADCSRTQLSIDLGLEVPPPVFLDNLITILIKHPRMRLQLMIKTTVLNWDQGTQVANQLRAYFQDSPQRCRLEVIECYEYPIQSLASNIF